jgi:nucleoside-diphosphate kinase
MITRFEKVGLKIVAMKMLVPTAEHVEAHYTLDPNWRMENGKKSIKGYTDRGQKHPLSDDPLVVNAETLRKLKDYLASGPVIPIILEGAHSVEIVRKIVGGTEPRGALAGTIRGDFVLDSYQMSDADVRSTRNLIHASGSVAEAEKEIKHWFKKDEIIDYRLVMEDILYSKNLDGLLK